MAVISEHDLRQSIADALQFISYFHPPDFIRHLSAAYRREESAPARGAIAQILRNSRMCAFGRRPICQDTGVANVFLKVGMGARIDSRRSLQAIVDDAVRDAYRAADNPLRASMVRDPLFDRRNTGDNAPGIVSVDLVEGDGIEVDVSAKGGGSENKARFTVLDPGESVADWVVDDRRRAGCRLVSAGYSRHRCRRRGRQGDAARQGSAERTSRHDGVDQARAGNAAETPCESISTTASTRSASAPRASVA